MSAATNAAMLAAMSSTPYALSGGAQVGGALPNGVEDSPLTGLLVAGEEALLGASGESGAVLFTSARVIIAEQTGIMSKRLAVKAFRRDTIFAYTIDPDKAVTLTLLGAFGQAALVFDPGFDPMLLSDWLGATLVTSTAKS